MGRSVYTDRNPSLIRELFTHEVVNEDAPANMNASSTIYFLRVQDNHEPPTHFVKKKEPK